MDGPRKERRISDAIFDQPAKLAAVVMSSVSGNVLEFYDFSLFAYFTKEISAQFLPGNDPVMKLIETFGIFASGFLMRPVGSVVLGALGDAKGTAWSLRLSMVLMALPTVLLGCLPSYGRVGMFAPIALALLRMLQGFTAGGELVGAILYTTELTLPSQRGFYCGLIMGSGGFGILLGCLVATVVEHVTPEKDMRWAWRVPFICGIVVAAVGILMRSSKAGGHHGKKRARTASARPKALSQSSTAAAAAGGPVAVDMDQPRQQQQQHPGGKKHSEDEGPGAASSFTMLDAVRDAWKHHKVQCTVFVLLCAGSQVTFYLNYVFAATYMSQLSPKPLQSKEALGVTALGLALYTVTAPTLGYVSDFVGVRKVVILCASTLVVLPPILYQTCFSSGRQGLCFLAIILLTLPLGGLAGSQMSWMIKSAHPDSRYTVIAVSYNIAAAVLAGTAPMVGTTIVKRAPELLAGPGIYLSTAAMVTLLTVLATSSVPFLSGTLVPDGEAGYGDQDDIKLAEDFESTLVAAPTA